MKNRIKLLIIMALIFSMLFSQCVYAAEDDLTDMIQSSVESLQNSFESKEKSILMDEKILPAGSSASDWIAMVLAFSGEQDAYQNYLERLESYVVNHYAEQGYLDEVKATEYHRISLTMLALGGDPTKILAGNETINLVADGTWNFCGGSPGEQGSNGLVYALLILNAKNYPDMEIEADYCKNLITELSTYQEDEGGFFLNTSFGADVDMTAMALQALAFYQNMPEVQSATNQALNWLSEKLPEIESVESFAQIILALCALGIDPAEDTRFISNGETLLNKLNLFRMENEMYKHEMTDETSNLVATYQSILALEAVQALRTEGRWILDFNEYELPENANSSGVNSEVYMIAGAAAAILIVAAVVTVKRKNTNKKNA